MQPWLKLRKDIREILNDGIGRPDDPTARTSRDQDLRKGVVEDGRPSGTANAPGLDGNGLPDDETAIAEDALGAREDQSQG
jgi:hypothetical protein